MIVITSVFCKAQSTGEIESVNASIIAKTKRIYSTVNGRTLIFYKDTAYTVAMVVKTNNLQVGEKLVIKVGLTQNDTIALNQKFKIKDKPNNGRAIGQDVTPYVEIDEVTNGYVKLFFDFPASDFEKLKWVTAFIKNDTNSSTKKYYEFQ